MFHRINKRSSKISSVLNKWPKNMLCMHIDSVVLPSRGTLKGWRSGLTGISESSTWGSAKSCTWRGTTPGTSAGPEASQPAGPEQRGWSRWPPEVPSNLSHPVILWYANTLLCVSTKFMELLWPKFHHFLYGTHSDYYHRVRHFMAADDHLEQLKPEVYLASYSKEQPV